MYMQAKPSKFYTVALKSSTGHLFTTKLEISGRPISNNDTSSMNFLSRAQHPDSKKHQYNKETLTSKLSHKLAVDACPLAVDACPLAMDACPLIMHQRLWFYKAAISPHLSRLSMIEILHSPGSEGTCKQWHHVSSRDGVVCEIFFNKLLLPCSCKRWTSLPRTHITIFEPTNSQTVPSTDLIQLQHQTSCRGSPGG